MNIKITEDDALWERVFRDEFCEQNIEVCNLFRSDIGGACPYQEEKHDSLSVAVQNRKTLRITTIQN